MQMGSEVMIQKIKHDIQTELDRYSHSHKHWIWMKENELRKHNEKMVYIESMIAASTNKHTKAMASLLQKEKSLSKY